MFKEPLVEQFGTDLTPISRIFSIAIVMLGLSAAVFGKWVERSGPRKAMFTAGLCWSAGFLVAALGVATDCSCGWSTWATACWAASAWASATSRRSRP